MKQSQSLKTIHVIYIYIYIFVFGTYPGFPPTQRVWIVTLMYMWACVLNINISIYVYKYAYVCKQTLGRKYPAHDAGGVPCFFNRSKQV